MWIDCLGRPAQYRDFHAWLGELTGRPVDREAIDQQREAHTRAAIDPQPAMPGVIELIDAARARGVKLAIASGSSHRWVDQHLARLGLRGRFDAVVCGEDTEAHKPEPAPYLESARRLGARPPRCIAIEDSPNGVASAHAAGMFTLAVPTAMTRDLRFPGADRVVASLNDLPPDEVLACVG